MPADPLPPSVAAARAPSGRAADLPARTDQDWATLYRHLYVASRQAGAFEPTPGLYALRLALTLGGLGCAWVVLCAAPGWPLRVTMLVLAAICGVQCGMLSHDAGHGQIARRWQINALIGHLCDTIAIGYAFNHWRHRHDQHHAHPNEALADPDIRTPFFALAPGQPQNRLAPWLIPHQGWLLWIVLTHYAFVIRVRTTLFALTDAQATRTDRLGLLAHATLWLGLPMFFLPTATALANYALWTLGLGIYFSGSFVWNHLGAPVVLPGERLAPFEQRLRCARSLRGGPWMTALFGGLNLHAEHHLFPQAPTGRLGLVRKELTRLSQEAALEWEPVGFWRAIFEVGQWFSWLARDQRRARG